MDISSNITYIHARTWQYNDPFNIFWQNLTPHAHKTAKISIRGQFFRFYSQVSGSEIKLKRSSVRSFPISTTDSVILSFLF